MIVDDLCDDNFLIFAMKSYESPHAIMSEFEEDLKRIKYIKRLVKKYKLTGDLKERLILNHLIVLSNVFSPESTVRMLFFRFDSEDYHILKTFLLFLNYMPKIIPKINGSYINSSDISIDLFVARRLRESLNIIN